MKKTYISPSFVMVQLNPCAVIAVSSLGLDGSDGNKINSSGEILVNEHKGVSDVNVWDSEW